MSIFRAQRYGGAWPVILMRVRACPRARFGPWCPRKPKRARGRAVRCGCPGSAAARAAAGASSGRLLARLAATHRPGQAAAPIPHAEVRAAGAWDPSSQHHPPWHGQHVGSEPFQRVAALCMIIIHVTNRSQKQPAHKSGRQRWLKHGLPLRPHGPYFLLGLRLVCLTWYTITLASRTSNTTRNGSCTGAHGRTVPSASNGTGSSPTVPSSLAMLHGNARPAPGRSRTGGRKSPLLSIAPDDAPPPRNA